MKPARWVLVVFAVVGCVARNNVRPNDLTHLDGYQGSDIETGADHVVETVDGQKMSVRHDAYLFLDTPAAHVGGRFQSITVRDGVFDGRTVDGRQVQVPIAEVTQARVEQPNPFAIAAIFGSAAGVLLAVAVFFVVTKPFTVETTAASR